MSQGTLSDAVRRFLVGPIGTVERLDLLLFLQLHATRWWGAHELAEELRMPAVTVQSHLEHLSAQNLLDVRLGEALIYRYEPAREELSRLGAELAQVHYLHRDEVVAALARRSADGARLFAAAFQLRKGKGDG